MFIVHEDRIELLHATRAA